MMYILVLINASVLINAPCFFSLIDFIKTSMNSCFLLWIRYHFQVESTVNPIALRKAKIACNFGLSECNRVRGKNFCPLRVDPTSKGGKNGRFASCESIIITLILFIRGILPLDSKQHPPFARCNSPRLPRPPEAFKRVNMVCEFK